MHVEISEDELHVTVADPGFSRRGGGVDLVGGGVDSRGGYVFENFVCQKRKNWDP